MGHPSDPDELARLGDLIEQDSGYLPASLGHQVDRILALAPGRYCVRGDAEGEVVVTVAEAATLIARNTLQAIEGHEVERLATQVKSPAAIIEFLTERLIIERVLAGVPGCLPEGSIVTSPMRLPAVASMKLPRVGVRADDLVVVEGSIVVGVIEGKSSECGFDYLAKSAPKALQQLAATLRANPGIRFAALVGIELSAHNVLVLLRPRDFWLVSAERQVQGVVRRLVKEATWSGDQPGSRPPPEEYSFLGVGGHAVDLKTFAESDAEFIRHVLEAPRTHAWLNDAERAAVADLRSLIPTDRAQRDRRQALRVIVNHKGTGDHPADVHPIAYLAIVPAERREFHLQLAFPPDLWDSDRAREGVELLLREAREMGIPSVSVTAPTASSEEIGEVLTGLGFRAVALPVMEDGTTYAWTGFAG